jgi:hypothetical protein
MPSIQRLTRPKPTSVVIDLGDGDAVNVSFDANKITPAWVNQTQREDVMAVARALADVVLEWDVVADEQGTPYLPTIENIAALSYPAETKIAMKLIEASSPSSAEGNDLGTTSSSLNTNSSSAQENPLNGQQSSTLPVASESPLPR